eukprot:5498658-Pleurochrysis_carterae.AAC.1
MKYDSKRNGKHVLGDRNKGRAKGGWRRESASRGCSDKVSGHTPGSGSATLAQGAKLAANRPQRDSAVLEAHPSPTITTAIIITTAALRTTLRCSYRKRV